MNSPSTAAADAADATAAALSTMEDISSSSGVLTRSSDQDHALALSQVEAHQENRDVKRFKHFVILALVVAAAVVATLVHISAAQDERQNFAKDVQTFTNEIVENAELVMRDYASVLQSLSTTATSNAQSGQELWPNVTIPFFEIRTHEARRAANLEVFIFAPLVKATHRNEWESYAIQNQAWIREGLEIRNVENVELGSIPSAIFPVHGGDNPYVQETADDQHDNYTLMGYHLPVWQVGGVDATNASMINMDLLSHPAIAASVQRVMTTKRAVLSPIMDVRFLVQVSELEAKDDDAQSSKPYALIVQPVFDSLDENTSSVTGFVIAAFGWHSLFENTPAIRDMVIVLSSSCGGAYTYVLEEKLVELLGPGDVHDQTFNNLQRRYEFEPLDEWDEAMDDGNETECKYSFDVYPTKALEARYTTWYPLMYASFVVFIFSATSVVFVFYDLMVQRRQKTVMKSALASNALIANMFPENVREKLLLNAEEQANKKGESSKQGSTFAFGARKQLTSFLDEIHQEKDENASLFPTLSTKPIADLFTHATVMFADIAGFTAWSSIREPSQVFTLLETVYASFDKVAKTLKVFKVETIGDCYVAVAGLPAPRNDHATAMSLFASECLRRFEVLSKQLETILGPGTGSLALRVGLHSGPVTAGVLRGDNARFQLFGDTVNVAARMESTGEKGRIQVSQETATILLAAGKKLTLRDKKVGLLQTYWLNVPSNALSSSRHSIQEESLGDEHGQGDESDIHYLTDSLGEQMDRLVDWNTNNLVQILRVVEGRRFVLNVPREDPDQLKLTCHSGKVVLDEVKEIIMLPKFDASAAKHTLDVANISLKPEVAVEARLYVQEVASLYQANPFHNFEHASHVAMSVVKLLSRIVAPEEVEFEDGENKASQLHDHTYGITSDPLTCFACVFSALIHDCDHSGVPNTQLAKEDARLARKYRDQSVAEQHSVDTAWQLLEQPRFSNFRGAVFVNSDEMTRFRQLVVNSVMATDIMDKQLKELRNDRWEKAFDVRMREQSMLASNGFEVGVNRKATIVIEHLIQASDVAHTMQHWHVYRQWNEKLYIEMYQAFKDGRSDTDPTIGWYNGEIGFFDYYIIPLAKKLADCGVFGVSSFEYLNFATRNREEWVSKGEQIVQEMRRAVDEQ